MRAFWKYDLFPYCLSGTITEIIKRSGKDPEIQEDYVETKEFGRGYIFKPFMILPNEEGLELATKIDQLRIDYDNEMKNLKLKHNKRINKLIKEYGNIPDFMKRQVN